MKNTTLARAKALSFLALFGLISSAGFSQCTDLFFSEYIEGSSNNKAIEIYNPTAASVDMTDYELHRFTNGSTSSTSIAMTGTLVSGDVYVVAHTSSDAIIQAASDLLSASVNHNGNDGYCLINAQTGDTLDIFGKIGEDPGTNWTSGAHATSDMTLTRMKTIVTGVSTNPASGFPTLVTEWDTTAIDDFSGLGSHMSYYVTLAYDTICIGDSVMLGGAYQLASGTFSDTLTTTGGCDSVVTTELLVTYWVANSLTICSGDSAMLEGAYQTIAGVYYDTTVAVTGCDSVVETTLILNAGDATSETTWICTGDSILLGGSFQTAAGSYVDSLSNMYGCDSIITTTLVLDTVSNMVDTAWICSGDSIMLAGLYQMTAGTYSDTLASLGGCDSIISTVLVVNPSYLDSVSISICIGDSAMLGGSYQTVAGSYTDAYATAAGCDSTVISTLWIDSGYTGTTTAWICLGDSIMLEGTYQHEAGSFLDTLQNVNGCDSIITTTLMLDSGFVGTSALAICAGDSVMINGSYESTAGTYSDSLQTIYGCDSVLTVTLSINAIPDVDAGADVVICGSGTEVLGGAPTTSSAGATILWNNAADLDDASLQNPTTSATANTSYTVVVTSTDGCVASDDVDLIVSAGSTTSNSMTICEGDTYVFGTQTITTAGTYTETLSDVNGCDSTVTLTVGVNALPDGIYAQFMNGDDKVICPGDSVQITGKDSIPGTPTFFWNPQGVQANTIWVSPTTTTTYTVTGTNSSGCSQDYAITVEVRNEPTMSASESIDAAACRDTITIISDSAISYIWLAPTGQIQSANNVFVVAITDTVVTYYVTGISQFGCKTTFSVNVAGDNDCWALAVENMNVEQLSINTKYVAVDESLNLLWTSNQPSNSVVRIFDITGSMIYEGNMSANENKSISMNGNGTGIYVLYIEDDNGKVYAKKFVKN